MQTGSQLRRLFVTILKDCVPTEPAALWERFKQHICDDLQYHLQNQGVVNPTEEDAYDYGLYLIDKDLTFIGLSLSKFEEMPLPDFERWEILNANRLIAEQLAYDVEEQAAKANTRIAQLNEGQ